jgi:hypothetical protein
LIGGGARMQAVLEFAADNQVTLALDGDPPAPLTAIRSQAGGVVGKTTGTITAPDAVRAKANRLAIKLIPYAGKLVGRVLASAARPGTVLPYVISLSHARS